MNTALGSRAFGTALALSMLAGCGTGSQPPMAAPGSMPARVLLPDGSTPPACKKQKKTKDYASAAEKFSKKGGSLCIPSFHGYGGKFTYPTGTASASVTVTSSTTDYASIPAPEPASQVPIFYLNLSSSGGITFNTKKAGGTLEGKGLKAKSTYSALLEGSKLGFWRSGVAQCYSVAKSGKDGGVLDIGSLLNGLQLGGIGYGQFEVFIYPGQYGNPCS